MLIEFSVSNFRSIYEKQTLSMVAAKLTGKENTQTNIFTPERYKNLPLLKTAAIYGANASGKSNLLKAMDFFQALSTYSTTLKNSDKFIFSPFKLNSHAISEPTSFEMEFIATDGIRYIYGFSLTENEVIEEHLLSFTSNKPTEIFIRKKTEPIKFSNVLKGHKKILEEQLQKNHLLLTKAANSNFYQLLPVYNFIYSSLASNFGEKGYSSFTINVSSESNEYSEKYRERVIQLLKAADTGIESYDIETHNGEEYFRSSHGKEQEILYNKELRTKIVHKFFNGDTFSEVKWDLEEESDGTIKLFNFAALIITVLDSGMILYFDELNISWHPLITELVINLFNNAETNPKNAQLIFTTHDATLLNKDLLRRDQMWFVEKNKQGMSKLFSLADFDKKEVRWDIPFDKWYLSGRFGAIPNIQEFKMNMDEHAESKK